MSTNRARSRANLTPCEQKTLAAFLYHETSKDVARATGVGKRTVDFHLRNAYQKLDPACRAQALIRAGYLKPVGDSSAGEHRGS